MSCLNRLGSVCICHDNHPCRIHFARGCPPPGRGDVDPDIARSSSRLAVEPQHGRTKRRRRRSDVHPCRRSSHDDPDDAGSHTFRSATVATGLLAVAGSAPRRRPPSCAPHRLADGPCRKQRWSEGAGVCRECSPRDGLCGGRGRGSAWCRRRRLAGKRRPFARDVAGAVTQRVCPLSRSTVRIVDGDRPLPFGQDHRSLYGRTVRVHWTRD